MSKKIQRSIITTRKEHLYPLTEDNYFTRNDAAIANNARISLEIKNTDREKIKTQQLSRFLESMKNRN